ncbi:MAG: hypothetical protein Q8R28_05865 [Dehalococcoidia bacterium]|nr:hypothetical protein [Dehalococcoidia bacterium]
MKDRATSFLKGVIGLFDYDSDYTIGALFGSLLHRDGAVVAEDEEEVAARGRSHNGAKNLSAAGMHLGTILGVVAKLAMSATRLDWRLVVTSIIVGTLAYHEIYSRTGKKRDWYSRFLFCFYNGYFWQSVIHDGAGLIVGSPSQ